MSQIKMEFTLELTDQKTVKAFADFLNTISGGFSSMGFKSPAGEDAKAEEEMPTKAPAGEDAKAEEEMPTKAPAKRASRAKNQEAKAPEAASNAEDKEADYAPSTEDAGEEVTDTKTETKAAPSVSLDDIRSNMSKKVADHREALQKKLKEFGAKNITTLPEDKYDDFNQFILDL